MSQLSSTVWSIARAEWLDEHGVIEEEVFRDTRGEYFVDVTDEGTEDGETFETKIYLPEDLQSHYEN